MSKLFFYIVTIFGLVLHFFFFNLNEVLKVADSFAYLQMAEYLKSLSVQGFGSGWFGFLYSLPLAFFDFFLDNHFLSAKIVNLLLFFFSGQILYRIGKTLLDEKYAIFMLLLFYISPILMHFNIAILSENIYIFIFLLLFSGILNFMKDPHISDGFFLAFFLALMYYTRGEAFIYLGAVGMLSFILLFQNKKLLKQDFWEKDKAGKRFTIGQFVSFNIILILSFSLFVAPYVYHLHTITGEWGLSNKGSSNLRQAVLRGKEKMDDDGFEQAVAELTPDNHQLIAGFAGGLDYVKPTTEMSLGNYVLSDPDRFFSNWRENQVKLYSQNLPHILLGDGATLYYNEGNNFFYSNKLYFLLLIIPLLLFVIGVINLFRRNNKEFIISLICFFFIASIFFTLFFTLNRYFLIFLPLFLIVIVYGIQTLDSFITFTFTGFSKKNINTKNVSGQRVLKAISGLVIVIIYSLGLISYHNTYKLQDDYYSIKQTAGIWLKENAYKEYIASANTDCKNCELSLSDKNEFMNSLKILERFPIVTYYAGTQKRWITPYTASYDNLMEYIRFNEIDYLVVDTLDFQKYRPDLAFLLDETKHFYGLKKVHIERKSLNSKLQKVIIFQVTSSLEK